MKRFLVSLIILLSCVGLSVSAGEQYNASTYNSDMNKNFDAFKQIYDLLSRTSESKAKSNGYKYAKYDDILNYNVIPPSVKRIDGGFLIPAPCEVSNLKCRVVYNHEIKFYKLKDTCTPVPSDSSKINASTACGKVVVDVNGFNYGTNKYFNDKNTLQPKERGVLWMYSNGIKVAPNSIEDIIITITK